jgi:hypothetical protein
MNGNVHMFGNPQFKIDLRPGGWVSILEIDHLFPENSTFLFLCSEMVYRIKYTDTWNSTFPQDNLLQTI